MKFFESKMPRMFGTSIGIVLRPGPNKVEDADAEKLIALKDTQQRVAEGLLVVTDAKGKPMKVPEFKLEEPVKGRPAPKLPTEEDETEKEGDKTQQE
jgi:hypothetical protein